MLDLVLNTRIAAYAKAGLYRQRRTLDNSVYRIFCSNDYLGLSQHPAVIAALQSAAAHDGVGSGASHLVSGYSEAHQQLELAFASFLKRERALLFTNGIWLILG
jgi:8-amino-7-oxononanoate synthase